MELPLNYGTAHVSKFSLCLWLLIIPLIQACQKPTFLLSLHIRFDVSNFPRKQCCFMESLLPRFCHDYFSGFHAVKDFEQRNPGFCIEGGWQHLCLGYWRYLQSPEMIIVHLSAHINSFPEDFPFIPMEDLITWQRHNFLFLLKGKMAAHVQHELNVVSSQTICTGGHSVVISTVFSF